MHTRDVAIATITLARNDRERDLLLAALRDLARADLPVFATDGGSGREFVEEVRKLEGFRLCQPEGAGLWPQVRASLKAAAASGAQFILYTEPDKRDFFREGLAPLIAESPDDAGVGVVLASRAQRELSTFPAFQQYTESVINRCCAEVTGQAFDFSYGPFLLQASVVQHLDPRNDDVGWGWRTYTFAIAHRLGLRLEQRLRGRACPPEQRSDAESIYRMEQLAQSLEGLVLATKAKEAAFIRPPPTP